MLLSKSKGVDKDTTVPKIKKLYSAWMNEFEKF